MLAARNTLSLLHVLDIPFCCIPSFSFVLYVGIYGLPGVWISHCELMMQIFLRIAALALLRIVVHGCSHEPVIP